MLRILAGLNHPNDSNMSNKVLVVDSDRHIESLLTPKFQRQILDQKLQFISVNNGREAIDQLQTNQSIDIILTDVNIPEIDGVSLLQRLHDLNLLNKVVVISNCADIGSTKITNLNNMEGAVGFVVKPIDIHDLEITLSKALQTVQELKEQSQALQKAQTSLQQINEELEIRVEQRTQELRKANEQLQRSNSLLHAQKEAALDGIVAVDEQGCIISYNQRFHEMWGIPERVLHPEQNPQLLALLQYTIKLPDEFIGVIENAYDQPDVSKNMEVNISDGRVFDCYSSPVYSALGKFYGIIWHFRDISDRVKAERALKLEKAKSERLLRNVLPERIAERLKQNRTVIADRFEDVTVLFADIVNFTRLSIQLSPRELVALLNQIFSKFDQVVETYGLEKIKTIGDSYMVAGGLPIRNHDHAEAIADLALNMQAEITKFTDKSGNPLAMRIGINTGEVIAGVIGTTKFTYDLWGDTVNIASRMESQGVANQIQVTATTYERLKSQYLLQKRGILEIKGVGEVTTYILIGKLTSS